MVVVMYGDLEFVWLFFEYGVDCVFESEDGWVVKDFVVEGGCVEVVVVFELLGCE